MKKYVAYIIVFLLSIHSINAEKKFRRIKFIEQPAIKVDSILTYFWSNEQSDWYLDQSWTNPNTAIIIDSAGLHGQTIVINRETGDYVSRETFQRFSDNRIITHTYQIWSNGTWLNTRRDSYQYNPFAQVSEFKIERWRNGSWINDIRYSNYIYNENHQIVSYEEDKWIESTWTAFATETRSYNKRQELIERVNSYANGTYRYRFLFSYNHRLNTSEWVYETYTPELKIWITKQKLITQLDNCDKVQSQTRQHNYDGIWINYSKKVFFRSLNLSPEDLKHSRLAVCHKGKTLYLPFKAARRHVMKHGDCYGPCSEKPWMTDDEEDEHDRECDCEDDDDEKDEQDDEDYQRGGLKSKLMLSQEALIEPDNTVDINIYPNPFHTHLVVEFGDTTKFNHLKIIDIQGRVLVSRQIDGENKLKLPGDGLEKGMYFLILEGSEIKSVNVIKR